MSEETYYTLHLNLRKDLDDYARSVLLTSGDGVIKHEDFPLLDLMRYRRRKLPVITFNILRSKEFTCPAEYEDALKFFESQATSGADLNPFLSKQVEQLKSEDDMLTDWGIRHFHLSTEKKGDFMKRSGRLLLAMVVGDTIYEITTIPHQGKNTWTDFDYLRIVQSNWPELMEPWELKGVTGLSEKVDEDVLKQVRKAHCNTAFEINGKFYASPGGGMATDRTPTLAVMEADKLNNWMRSVQKAFEDGFDNLVHQAHREDELNIEVTGKLYSFEFDGNVWKVIIRLGDSGLAEVLGSTGEKQYEGIGPFDEIVNYKFQEE